MLTSKRLSALVTILLVALSAGLVQFTGSGVADEKEAKTEKAKAPAHSENIDKLIAQLGADSYQEREEAIQRLIAVGSPALGALRRIADDKRADPDVRLRAARAAFAIATVKIEMVRRLGEHRGERNNPAFRRATHVALSPDGKHAATSGTDNIRYWDLVSRKMIRAFGDISQGYRSVSFAPDGQSIVAGGQKGNVHLFDVNTGKLLHEMAGHTAEVWGVLFTADGKQVLTGSFDRSIRVWDATTGKQVRTFKGVVDPIRCLALSPNGKLLAAGHCPAGRPGMVRLWDVERGTEAVSMKGHKAEITSVAFSADGKFLVSTSFDQTVRIWRVADGSEVKCLKGHEAHVECAVFTPDGRRVLSCAWDEDPTLRLWDAASGKQLGASERMAEGLLSIAVLPDGQHALSTGKDGAVRLWRWTR
jgi:WD40 repeat protein